ncbi:hypothetical protein N0Y54_24160 [Nostoc punctiforme UO1]|uniref:hypothetical protein n=1 Tax=Nostoc punctiforme TaxID=272131 RepID=UPI0030B1B31B
MVPKYPTLSSDILTDGYNNRCLHSRELKANPVFLVKVGFTLSLSRKAIAYMPPYRNQNKTSKFTLPLRN